MTKYLVKIISICAFVVLLPVVITGVALSALGSTMFNLDVHVAYVGGKNVNASAGIIAGAKDEEKLEQKKEKVSVSYLNGTDLTVSVNPVGYDFLGWFNGDNTITYNAANRLDKENEGFDYTFTLTGNTQMVVFLQSKQYNLVFKGVDKDGQDIGTAFDGKEYRYGDQLPQLDPPTDNSKGFLGWTVSGGNGEVINTAKFDSSNVNGEPYILEAKWTENLFIDYYNHDFFNDQDVLFYHAEVGKNEFDGLKFLEAGDENYERGLGAGYEFKGWQNLDQGKADMTEQEIIEGGFVAGKTYRVFMNKSPIEYTLTVGDNGSTMTYNVVDKFEGTDPERKYYNFVGLNFNGVDYLKTTDERGKTIYVNTQDGTTKDLGSEIVKAGNKAVEVQPVWECKFEYVNLVYTFINISAEENAYIYATPLNGEEDVILNKNVNGDMFKAQFRGDEKINVEDSIVNLLLGYEKIYLKNEDGSETELELNAVQVYYGTDLSRNIAKENRIADIFDALALENKTVQDKGQYTIRFQFKEKIGA